MALLLHGPRQCLLHIFKSNTLTSFKNILPCSAAYLSINRYSTKSKSTPSLEQRNYLHQDTKEDDPLVAKLYNGVVTGKRASLAQAITLAETTNAMKKAQAQVLMQRILKHAQEQQKHSLHKVKSLRIGMV